MKAVVVYDSTFGNTERLAQALAAQLGAGEPATVAAAGAASERDLAGMDLLAVAGPTQGHELSPGLKAFLDRLPPEAVRDVTTMTFDMRLLWPQFLSGSAAAAIAKRLVRATAPLPPRFRAVVPPPPEMPYGARVATMRPIRHWRAHFHN